MEDVSNSVFHQPEAAHSDPDDVFLFPSSFAQQRLWFLDKLEPGQSTYNVPFAIRLIGHLEIELLERSLREIVTRHEVLRTTFSEDEEGIPIQVVAAKQDFRLPVDDLRAAPVAGREAEACRRLVEEARAPFDLKKGPLFRARLLRLADEENVLLLVLHHSIVDGWSWGILFREISAFYEGLLQNRPSGLRELPVQYGDYATWQRDWLQGEQLEDLLNYWKKQLQGAPTVLELPTDFPRPAVQTFNGGQQTLVLPRSLEEKLKELSQSTNSTLFMTLLSAFTLLMARYSGQEDIVIGSPVSGRSRVELEGLIGFFVNTLPFRTELTGNPTVRDFLARVRETTLQAYAHQDLPFERLVEELKPERDLSRSPLVQVLFIFENASAKEKSQIANLTVKPFRGVEGMTAKFDLTLNALAKPEGLRLGLTYNIDLFTSSTAERMLGHLHTLLEAIVADPDRRISELNLLSQSERNHLLLDFNATAAAYPNTLCVHQLFEQQAKRTPGATAVLFEGEQLTYAELNERSNRLAHFLRSQAVGPKSLVGICMERSTDMVTAMLAILKAGAAYVPIDPEYPRDRREFMLRDSAVSILLTQERLRQQLSTDAAKVVCLDTAWPEIEACSPHDLSNLAKPEDLVYVIYTSGSTGQPKGVCLPHRALTNLLFWQLDNSQAGVGTRTLQFTSLSFDVSFQEIFSTWCSGGTLVLVSELVRRDASALLNFLREHRISRLFLPFVALQQLAEAAEDAEHLPEGMMEVITAGEQLRITRQVADLFRRMPSCSLFNHYGPSESHVCTSFRLVGPPDKWDALPPIGTPIANSQIYILDLYGNPTPLGVSGELYIGGICLAEGYLNRPELTSRRFVANPFSSDPEARLYRTGDLCRYLPDGNIQYLGRVDNQVKLRGYRIELGEVESVLARHPAVQHAVAVVREDVPGDKRLVAYIVSGDQEISPSELRTYLKQTLPEYMIPSAFVSLESLPLTPSGKVSRRALPTPDWESGEGTKEAFGFRTPIEELLAGIWSEVLRSRNIDVHDNFFELGGHSLLATQVVSRIRRALHIDVPLRAIFEHPTIQDLARLLEGIRKGGQADRPPSLVRQPRGLVGAEYDTIAPLSFSEQRLWMLDRLEPNSSVYNLSIGLRLNGSLNVRALEMSIEEIQRRHEVLRAQFRLNASEPEQVIRPASSLSLPIVDISGAENTEVKAREIVRVESQRPFNLAQDAMLRATLIRLGADDHVLLLTVHHIVFDGWSRSILVRELSTLYQAYSEGKPSPLPDLPLQYTDFSVWQRQYLSGKLLQTQLEYWKQQLASAPAYIELPTDRPRPPLQSFHGAHFSSAIAQGTADKLNSLSRKSGVTLYMSLLAAFTVLLSRYSRQDEIVVGSPIAGRSQGELEKLIGFFVNTLPLRIKVADDISFRELLGRVREITLDAYAHQDLPFEKLVEEIKPQRDRGRNPVFQVMFALQNTPNETFQLPGLQISPFRSGQAVNAKFDLSLIAVEHPDGLTATFEYNTDLFDRATIERMSGHFFTLLEAVVADANVSVASLQMISDAERSDLLQRWNECREYPVRVCVHQLFEAQAKRNPQNIALVFNQQSLNYGDLNARSNRLARYLQRLGVGPEVLVGLCVERSVDLVVGILAILKAGGAYLPLDPRYPKDRLAFMVEDARPAVVLTQSELQDVLPATGGKVVAIDDKWPDLEREEASDVPCAVQPDNLAYVIYTSGSTGRPKGCQVTHANIARLFHATQHWYHFDEHDVWTLFHSYAFDFSVWELWGALIYGGRLILVPYLVSRSPEEFYELLEKERVTVLNQTPSSFRQLMQAEERLGRSKGLSLRYVIFGGEALDMHGLQPWFERHGDQTPQLVNMYGITETTVHVTYRALSRSDITSGSVIGCPIPDLQLYLLDRNLEPAPIGVPGEIYVGGAGVARGYLNRPDLNAERFIPDPFRPERCNRLYKSGDLARRLANGDIEYLGRIDEQVKIRGFRIELGEIEGALAQHPAVQQAVVSVLQEETGDKRLVAYVVGEEKALSSDGLREYLKQSLPEYMVPSAFVPLPSFPLTANGKVDRRALPAPDGNLLGSLQEFVRPRNPVEEKLAAIWSEVLRLPEVGVHHDFFALGGHSLLAIQVVSRIQTQFKRDMALRTLFDNPTIAQLALALAATDQASVSHAEPVIAPASRAAFKVKRTMI
jgi:amino acid adenylation domain-containing protein